MSAADFDVLDKLDDLAGQLRDVLGLLKMMDPEAHERWRMARRMEKAEAEQPLVSGIPPEALE